MYVNFSWQYATEERRLQTSVTVLKTHFKSLQYRPSSWWIAIFIITMRGMESLLSAIAQTIPRATNVGIKTSQACYLILTVDDSPWHFPVTYVQLHWKHWWWNYFFSASSLFQVTVNQTTLTMRACVRVTWILRICFSNKLKKSVTMSAFVSFLVLHSGSHRGPYQSTRTSSSG